MRNRKHSKITILILTLAMMLSMGTFVFAAQDTVGDATIETKTSSATLNIPKTLIVTNPEEIRVYGPTVTYNFTIDPATVTDGSYVESDADRSEEGDYASAVVNPGVADGVSVTTQPSFTSAETAAATGKKGVELSSNIVVTTDISKFTKAGIYRYELKDATTADTLTAAGITRETDYAATRYLDVYIYNDSPSGLKIGGYTLLKANETAVTGDNDTAKKSPGFISGSEKDETTGKVTTEGSEPTDLYNTINVKVEKEVTGGLGDKTNLFPFTIAVSNSGMTYYTTQDVAADVPGTPGSATSISKALKHGDAFLMKGLNPKAEVTYTEENNTDDTYQVTISDKDGGVVNSIDKKKTAKNETQTSGAQKVSNYVDSSTQKIEASDYSQIKFTNNLNEISPTNVVIRFAPYLFILGGAVMLLIVSRRRRTEEE